MRQENAIEVKNVTKAFRIYKDKGNSLKEKVLFRERSQYDVRTVLRGISFQVKKGEDVGLIGHNGCGKSTTLKLLTRIIYPDSGSIKITGRISSLLELGAGFHPDMSGRDNIYINASIFGLTRKEINERIDEIIEFSELGSYIDNPVRTYSSGMYMRLAFSVAINVNADVILVDEILAVGDLNFQDKCFRKLQKIKKAGTTIVIVSHSLPQIESICDRSIWINDGEIAAEGKPGLVHRKYLEFMGEYSFRDSAATDEEKQKKEQEKQKEKELAEQREKEETLQREKESLEEQERKAQEQAAQERFARKGTGEIRISKARLLNGRGEEKKVFGTGEDMKLEITLLAENAKRVNIYFGVLRMDYMLCFATTYYDEFNEFLEIKENGRLVLEFPGLALLPSRYMIDLRIFNEEGEAVDIYNEAVDFQVYAEEKNQGIFIMEHKWLTS